MTFADLLLDYLQAKGLTPNDFEDHTGVSKKRIYDNEPGSQRDRYQVLAICIGLGLNLLLTEIFMAHAGHTFRLCDSVDDEYKQVIKECKGKGIARLDKCYKHLEKTGVKPPFLPKYGDK